MNERRQVRPYISHAKKAENGIRRPSVLHFFTLDGKRLSWTEYDTTDNMVARAQAQYGKVTIATRIEGTS